MKFLIALVFVVGYVVCESPFPPQVVVEHTQDSHPDGSFHYAYKTSDGIQVESVGVPKVLPGNPPEHVETIEGSYSYTSPEGKIVKVEYKADETGYHPTVYV